MSQRDAETPVVPEKVPQIANVGPVCVYAIVVVGEGFRRQGLPDRSGDGVLSMDDLLLLELGRLGNLGEKSG